MIEITVKNCDDKEVQYEWDSMKSFVEDIDGENENIPMLDDVLTAVDTDNDEIAIWWRDSNGIIVNDLYEKCKSILL